MTPIDSIQSIIQPILVELLLTLILAVLAWFLRLLPERFRMDIEAKHRVALHSAINTGVGLLIDTMQKHPTIAAPDMAIGTVLDYVERSVPDAIRRLGPSRAQLEDMARAKLQHQLDAVLHRDRLTEALSNARLDGRNPNK